MDEIKSPSSFDMDQPLGILSPSARNLQSPPTSVVRNNNHNNNNSSRYESSSVFESRSYKSSAIDVMDESLIDDIPSSPFVSNVGNENVSPLRLRSPGMSLNRSPARSPNKSPSKSPSKTPAKSHSKNSSPDKMSSPLKEGRLSLHETRSPSKMPSPTKDESSALYESIARDREHAHAPIAIFQDEDDDSIMQDRSNENDTSASTFEGKSGFGGMDDTCFSTFSAVHNTDMTAFAGLRRQRDDLLESSPAKQLRMESSQGHYDDSAPTPHHGAPSTPGTVRRMDTEDTSPSPSPTPRRAHGSADGNTTNLILDFTEQFNMFASQSHQSPSRGGPGRRTPSSAKQGLPPATPSEQRNLLNLLDFDIPPAPTPRSVPSITARELESLKSDYLSQISSMKATLSGREAEVNSLKEAVGDAERRVGEALETIRDVKGAKESLESEKEDWEKRGRDMESVLRSVKEEIMRSDREREDLARKLDETEAKREEAETKAAEAESRVASMRTGSESGNSSGGDSSTTKSGGNNAKEIEAAVEHVARDLHALYKSKHETKVAALKKSYEARWHKRVSELEKSIQELNKENEELRIGRDATFSGVMPGTLLSSLSSNKEDESVEAAQKERERLAEEAKAREEELERLRVEDAQRSEEQKARVAALTAEIEAVKKDNVELRGLLEMERVEKGELVGAVEEMLSLNASSATAAAAAAAASSSNSSTMPNDALTSGSENLRGSVSRASSTHSSSGLRGPGFGSSLSSSIGPGSGTAAAESRIGRMGSLAGPPGSLSRSVSSRSGIMSSIERMGRGAGASGRGGGVGHAE
ncbi:MAG: hypothetical protein M1819_003824 [Sarea resinae]|nr:MAG: hypothetical protein M1819_003824 [Sarea resinae]